MNDPLDLLQIKIEKAKSELPVETQNAIAAVDWKSLILELRSRKGFTFEQLGDLEIETELLLCGLVSAKDYPHELERRLGISRSATNELVAEMNELVFSKIKQELIKNTERKKIFEESQKKEEEVLDNAGIKVIKEELEVKKEKEPIKEEREEILEKIEKPELIKSVPIPPPEKTLKLEEMPPEINPPRPTPAETKQPSPEIKTEETHPILSQKLSQLVQSKPVDREHSIEGITKTGSSTQQNTQKITYPKNADPYRMPVGE